MANEIIRPSALPVRTNPVPSEVVPSDNNVTVGGVSWEDGVNAAVPPASEAESEAGVINSKRMTPLTTKQAIDAQVPPKISSAIGALNLGSASQSQVSDFATAAQGALADTAVQPADLADVATSGDYEDLSNKPTARLIPAGGLTSQSLVKSSDADYATEWVTSAAATAVSYAPQTLTTAQQGQARANIGADILTGFRNKIINGDFDIWQRGVGLPAGTGTRYAADRWIAGSVGSTISVSRIAMEPGQEEVPGNPAFGIRLTVASVTGVGNYAVLQQKIEGARTLSGRRVTATFYAKSDAAKPVTLEFSQNFGTGGSPSAPVQSIGMTKINLTTSWKKYTLSFEMPSLVGKTYGTNDNGSLHLTLWLDAGSDHDIRSDALGQRSGTYDISHVSLVEGDATDEEDPFSPRHVQQELALCQRYFEIVTAGYSGPATAAVEYYCSAQPRVEKRATPSVSWYRANAVFRFPGTAPTIGISTVDGALFANMIASSTASTAYAFHSFYLDAEL